MSDARWAEVERLFLAAASRPAGERAALLEAATGDPEVRDEVERLLAADDHAGDFLEAAVAAGTTAFARTRTTERREGRIGPYRLLRAIGRGGMSSVYLAVRDDDAFQKRVAIKLLRRGMDTDDILRRFRAERQILASLDHPNIARLYDGGTTDDGLPYFVMEHVEGLPIDRYCDRRRLGVRARLELFRVVCAAVSYAHRNLVVHRDLKPSNVLVTAEGEPKLLDFGIAKLLNPELGGRAAEATATVVRALTPGYASPEQIRGGPVTTAGDVYSLGVLLYELLTGRRPHRLHGLPMSEVERRVCEVEPERPSTVVGRAAAPPAGRVAGAEDPREDAGGDDPGGERDAPAAIAEARGLSPQQLRRRLRGDLDNVVLTALRKEPERRYASVEKLSEDVARHLEGRPVAARPATLSYRVAKWVRRHRWGAAAAALVAGLLVAFAVAMAVQSARIARERDRAAQVSEMLVDLFEIADPGAARGHSITARELLDRGALKVRELPPEPETAVLMDTLARLYQELGLDERAVPLFERSLEIRRSAFGGDHPEVADSLNELGRAHASRGDFEAAEPLFRASYEMRRRLFGDDHPDVGSSLNNLALVNHDLGRYRIAERLYRLALESDRRLLGAQHPGAAITASNLALLLYDRGDYAAAEVLYREVVEVYEAAYEAGHPQIAFGLDYLAMTLHASGESAEAEELMRRALALREARHGPRHRSIARSLEQLGGLLRDRGELGAAGPLLRRAYELRRELLGEQHPELAASLESLAAWHAAAGDAAKAERYYRQALAVYAAALPEEHPLLARTQLAYGRFLVEQGEARRAEPLLRRALVVFERELPPEAPPIVEAAAVLAACEELLGAGT